MNYTFDSRDADQRRVWRPIGTLLDTCDIWCADVDFHFTDVPAGSGSGHIIISLSENSTESYNDCPDIPCTGNPLGTQDVLSINFTTSTPNTQDRSFRIVARDGGTVTEFGSVGIPAIQTNHTFFLRLERSACAEAKLSLFTDSARTIHAPGSPVTRVIPTSIGPFNFVQHGNAARGSPSRACNGWIDNLCITRKTILSPQNIDLAAALQSESQVFLQWEPQFPHLATHYTVWRRAATREWESVHQIPAARGTTFSWVDPQPYQGENFYKVLGTDQNGEVGASEIVSVYVSVNQRVLFYPNPANTEVFLTTTETAPVEYWIYDLAGKLVGSGMADSGRIEVSGLKSGVYQLQFRHEEETGFYKLVKR